MAAVQCLGTMSAAAPAAVTELTVAATTDAGALPVCLLTVVPAVLPATEASLVPAACCADVWLPLPDLDDVLVGVLEASLP
ncbi:MAG: hypothetical protein ACRDQZ_23870 [Mycobacteriales bacterium]